MTRAETSSPDADQRLARLAAAIAEPARARMLCCLLDGHARTATELATVAEVAPSTASAHLARLAGEALLATEAQGKHRYFRLAGPEVASALEALQVVAGVAPRQFTPGTPSRLRAARTCYDHLAGAAGVALHDHLHAQGWLAPDPQAPQPGSYLLSAKGERAMQALGVDTEAARARRRRFACACLDWSERRPHLGGALGAAWLELSLKRGWVRPDLDSRALTLTPKARREAAALFGVA